MLTHQEKVDLFIREARSHGINESTAAPLVFRVLWQKGIRIPPPLFLPLSALGVCSGLLFGAVTFSFFSLVSSLNGTLSLRSFHVVPEVVFLEVFIASMFGLTVAVLLGIYRHHMSLPKWKAYGETQPRR
jgi:hypothetical protein